MLIYFLTQAIISLPLLLTLLTSARYLWRRADDEPEPLRDAARNQTDAWAEADSSEIEPIHWARFPRIERPLLPPVGLL